jgi:predicted transcriptional regulator
LWKYGKLGRIVDIEKPLKFGDDRGFSKQIIWEGNSMPSGFLGCIFINALYHSRKFPSTTKGSFFIMFIQAKKKREELRLPILHYIVADDWMDKLGLKTFTYWLKFHTWVNRQDEQIDDISKAKIPMSLEKVAEKLEISISSLRRSLIPLWEYGLIDLVEYEDSNRKTTKPVNIIPYDYPQNNKTLETKPLEKCRDWKTDYNNTATYFGRQGGRPKNENICDDKGFKNETVEGFKNETVEGFKNETVTLSKMKPNNYSNNSINVSNNSLNHDLNTLLMDEEEKPLEETKLHSFLINRNIDPIVAKSIVELARQNEIDLYAYEVTEQLRQMYYETEIEGKTITNYPFYFLNGIVIQRQQRKTKKQHKELERIQQERLKNRQSLQRIEKPVFYNWLEE